MKFRTHQECVELQAILKEVVPKLLRAGRIVQRNEAGPLSGMIAAAIICIEEARGFIENYVTKQEKKREAS
jgi:hypothetical protein